MTKAELIKENEELRKMNTYLISELNDRDKRLQNLGHYVKVWSRGHIGSDD